MVIVLDGYAILKTRELIAGKRLTLRMEVELVATVVEGLPKTTFAVQLPAAADDESTMTTLPDDATLHAVAATEHTVALQLCEPKMKLAPNTVTVLPA